MSFPPELDLRDERGARREDGDDRRHRGAGDRQRVDGSPASLGRTLEPGGNVVCAIGQCRHDQREL
jgi:hypothetical protein